MTLVITALLLSCGSKKQPETKNPVSFTPTKPVALTAQLDSIKISKEEKLLFVHATLFNHSVDTFKYYAMSCSWTEAFTTDSKELTIQNNLCFSNWYGIKDIPPFKGNEYFLTIKIKDIIKENKFKIGFNLTPYFISQNDDQVFEALTDMKRLIWSYSIHFPNKKTGS